MRVLVLAVVVAACGGGNAPPPQQPMSNQVAAAPGPPPEPTSACGCTSERCRDDDETRWVKGTMCRYRERMCGCKDKPCADSVNEDFTRWMQRMAKEAGDRKPRPFTEDDAKQMADNATKYQDCYTKVVTASEPTSP